jgi:hypothetical protein
MSMDVLKMGLAQSFPGIDPRIHISLAIVTAVKVSAEGVKADVKMVPSQCEETVMVGPCGANGGSGLYIPITIGQVVIVAFPQGNADCGGQIIGSTWDTGDPPPSAAIDNPDDVALVAPRVRTIRVITTDNGNIILDSGGNVILRSVGDIVLESGVHTLLGTAQATLGVARLADTVAVTIPPGTILVENITPPFTPPYIPNPLPIRLTGTITSASDKVRSS